SSSLDPAAHLRPELSEFVRGGVPHQLHAPSPECRWQSVVGGRIVGVRHDSGRRSASEFGYVDLPLARVATCHGNATAGVDDAAQDPAIPSFEVARILIE